MSVTPHERAQIEAFLTAEQFEIIDQGLELMAALDDVALFESFLDGARVVRRGGSRGVDTLLGGRFFLGNTATQPYLDYALRGVLSAAPARCGAAARLKAQITSLQAVPQRAWRGAPATQIPNARTFSGFPALEYLSFKGCTELTSLAGLHDLPALRELSTLGCQSLEVLEIDELGPSPSLEILEVSGCRGLRSLRGVEGLTGLKTLTASGCRRLADLSGVEALTGLDALNLSGCGALQDLDALAGLTGLRWLGLSGCSLQQASALAGMLGLRHLEIQGTRIQNPSGLQSLFARFSASAGGMIALVKSDESAALPESPLLKEVLGEAPVLLVRA